MALWKIKIPRGNKANLPTLSLAELAYVKDEEELYIGGASGNVNITNNVVLKGKVDKSSVNNTLLVTDEGSVLDARQGKILKDEVDKRAYKVSTVTYKLYVPDDANFNTLLETGIYQISDSTNMVNAPTIASWSILEVVATNSYVKQTVTNASTGKIWVRVLSGTWSAWREI